MKSGKNLSVIKGRKNLSDKSEWKIAGLMKHSKTAIHNVIIRKKDSNEIKQFGEEKKDFDSVEQ